MKEVELKDEYYFYLDALQKSGKINMFETPRHLQKKFGISRQIAFAVFAVWSTNKMEERNAQ